MTKRTKPLIEPGEPGGSIPRAIEWGRQFRRDFKRESKGRHRTTLDDDLGAVVDLLANCRPLEARHHDHALKSEWKDHRDCHVKPDLVLIYRVTDEDVLQLVRLGSHSELSLT